MISSMKNIAAIEANNCMTIPKRVSRHTRIKRLSDRVTGFIISAPEGGGLWTVCLSNGEQLIIPKRQVRKDFILDSCAFDQ